jgi:uncharacterized coiled-coil protein SlyX
LSTVFITESSPAVLQELIPPLIQQVTSLRTSLSHLTSHLNLLSNRLAASESTLSSLKLLHHQQLSRVEEQRDGLRALCSVWEGRWREERRLREAEELAQRSAGELKVYRASFSQFIAYLTCAGGRALNDRHSRMETSYTALKPISKLNQPFGESPTSSDLCVPSSTHLSVPALLLGFFLIFLLRRHPSHDLTIATETTWLAAPSCSRGQHLEPGRAPSPHSSNCRRSRKGARTSQARGRPSLVRAGRRGKTLPALLLSSTADPCSHRSLGSRRISR